jgi:hypothetical protein
MPPKRGLAVYTLPFPYIYKPGREENLCFPPLYASEGELALPGSPSRNHQTPAIKK